jgi:hypothetical protein
MTWRPPRRLADFTKPFDSSGKTPAGWHHAVLLEPSVQSCTPPGPGRHFRSGQPARASPIRILLEDACQTIEELGREVVVEAGDISDGCVLARVMWNLQSPLDAFPLSEAATAGTRGYTQPTPLRQRAGLDEAHPGLPAYRGSLRPSHREVG